MLRSGGPPGASKEAEPGRSSRMRTLPPGGLKVAFSAVARQHRSPATDTGDEAEDGRGTLPTRAANSGLARRVTASMCLPRTGFFALIPGECLKPVTAWRSGRDSNPQSRFRHGKIDGPVQVS